VENSKRGEQISREIIDRAPILVALLHQMLNVEEFDSIADLADALKHKAARLRIPYDAARIADALAIVHRSRSITRGQHG
jgi:hypothetical protein